MIDDSTQYIARISYGKDSLKMLEVIKSRGLPLDRITTTDVWATDTISANLPPMEEFKTRMDQRIWDMYRIQVEHLCAMNKDGTKRTYEQMFYHVPKRKSGGYSQGAILGFPDLWNPWCQAALKRNAKPQGTGNHYRLPSEHPIQLVPETQNPSTDPRASRPPSPHGVENSRSTRSRPHFLRSAASQRARTEVLWNTLESLRTSLHGLVS